MAAYQTFLTQTIMYFTQKKTKTKEHAQLLYSVQILQHTHTHRIIVLQFRKMRDCQIFSFIEKKT